MASAPALPGCSLALCPGLVLCALAAGALAALPVLPSICAAVRPAPGAGLASGGSGLAAGAVAAALPAAVPPVAAPSLCGAAAAPALPAAARSSRALSAALRPPASGAGGSPPPACVGWPVLCAPAAWGTVSAAADAAVNGARDPVTSMIVSRGHAAAAPSPAGLTGHTLRLTAQANPQNVPFPA